MFSLLGADPPWRRFNGGLNSPNCCCKSEKGSSEVFFFFSSVESQMSSASTNLYAEATLPEWRVLMPLGGKGGISLLIFFGVLL